MIYLSSHFMHAASYATRAREFVWEMLWAIYGLRYPALGFNWNQSDEGHAWVLAQMQADPPIVFHVEVPEEDLRKDVERLTSYREAASPESIAGGMGVGIENLDRLLVVQETESDFWTDGQLLRFLAGATPAQIEQEVNDGKWGEILSYQGDKNWMWRALKS